MCSTSRHKPMEVLNEALLPIMTENGFVLLANDSNNNSVSETRVRYITKFESRRKLYANQEEVVVNIDVIAIPMGSALLLIHAMICDENRDEIKLKLRMNDTIDSIRQTISKQFVKKLIEILSISINDLPYELKLHIMSLLPIEAILKMSLVSSLWRDISVDDDLWRVLVKKHFPDLYCLRLNEESWKTIYKEAHRSRKLAERRKSWANRALMPRPIFPALPPSPPVLPILGPPFLPMLPPPHAYFRDLIPEEVRNAFPNIPSRSSRLPPRIPSPIPSPLSPNFGLRF